jgi:hypothetical protein
MAGDARIAQEVFRLDLNVAASYSLYLQNDRRTLT